MVDQDALLSVITDFSEALLFPYRVGDVLYRLVDQVVDVLGVDGAGVLIAEDGDALGFLAATDTVVSMVESQQVAGGEGPCQEAYQSGEQVTISDLAELTRWSSYRKVALEQGCHAVAALPMPADDRRIGALNLYQYRPHQWTEAELQVGQVLANMASGYILNHNELSNTRNVVDQLQHALDSRVVIEQAKGIIAARRNISTNEAFGLLRQEARSTSTRLHDLCRLVVESTNEHG